MKKLKGLASGVLYILRTLLFLAGAGGIIVIAPNLSLLERMFIVVVTILAAICLVAKAIGVVRNAWRKE
jgi:hypothetical protein